MSHRVITLSFSKCRMTLYPMEHGAQYSATDLQCSFCLLKIFLHNTCTTCLWERPARRCGKDVLDKLPPGGKGGGVAAGRGKQRPKIISGENFNLFRLLLAFTLLRRNRCQTSPVLFSETSSQFSSHNLCNSSCYNAPTCLGKQTRACKLKEFSQETAPAKWVTDDEKLCESVRAEQRGEPGRGEHGGDCPGKRRCCFSGDLKVLTETSPACSVGTGKSLLIFSSLPRSCV